MKADKEMSIEKAFGKNCTKIGSFFNPNLPNIASNWLLETLTKEEKHELSVKILGENYDDLGPIWKRKFAEIQDGWFDDI